MTKTKSNKRAKLSTLSVRRETLRRIQGLEFVAGGLAAPCMSCTGTDTWPR